MIPLVEEAAAAELFLDTATNVPSPWVTSIQIRLDGSALAVQVMPSVEEAADDELLAKVTNVPSP